VGAFSMGRGTRHALTFCRASAFPDVGCTYSNPGRTLFVRSWTRTTIRDVSLGVVRSGVASPESAVQTGPLRPCVKRDCDAYIPELWNFIPYRFAFESESLRGGYVYFAHLRKSPLRPVLLATTQTDGMHAPPNNSRCRDGCVCLRDEDGGRRVPLGCAECLWGTRRGLRAGQLDVRMAMRQS
jgi:hypothetical protein